MLRQYIIQDSIGALLLLTGCLLAGLVINEMRSAPLPLVYSATTVSFALNRDVDRDEMQKLSLNHGALILDARPESFYRLGHIPSALNLPRDDFDKQYQALQSILQSHRNQLLIIYCSNLRCPDSQVVAAALQKLGYPHIRLFRGGWNDWESANLPEEKE